MTNNEFISKLSLLIEQMHGVCLEASKTGVGVGSKGGLQKVLKFEENLVELDNRLSQISVNFKNDGVL